MTPPEAAHAWWALDFFRVFGRRFDNAVTARSCRSRDFLPKLLSAACSARISARSAAMIGSSWAIYESVALLAAAPLPLGTDIASAWTSSSPSWGAGRPDLVAVGG